MQGEIVMEIAIWILEKLCKVCSNANESCLNTETGEDHQAGEEDVENNASLKRSKL